MVGLRPSYDVVVVGAGAVGLAVARSIRRLLPSSVSLAVITDAAPMSLTSSVSTECYRDYWPSDVMRSFMKRSIGLLREYAEEKKSGGGGTKPRDASSGSSSSSSAGAGDEAFRMVQKGYLYVTKEKGSGGGAELLREAKLSTLPIRTITSSASASTSTSHLEEEGGNDDCLDFYPGSSSRLRERFPYLSSEVSACLHVRNAGWLSSAHTMGMSIADDLLSIDAHSNGGGLVDIVRARVVSIDTGDDFRAVKGVRVSRLNSSNNDSRNTTNDSDYGLGGDGHVLDYIRCGAVVNASGPYLNRVHQMMFNGGPSSSSPTTTTTTKTTTTRTSSSSSSSSSSSYSPWLLPIKNEVHAKVIFRDTLKIVPRDSPMIISNDHIELPWSDDERLYLEETYRPDVARRLVSKMSPGAHLRPYGGPDSDVLLMLWESWHQHRQPTDVNDDRCHLMRALEETLDHELYPEVVLRGLSTIIPDLAVYYDENHLNKWKKSKKVTTTSNDHLTNTRSRTRSIVDGGYYTKTEENVPLIGPVPDHEGRPIKGAFVCGALGGYGIMGSHAAGELVAMHLSRMGSSPSTMESHLPDYAKLMSPMRYFDEEFIRPGGIRDRLLMAGGGQL